MAKLSLEEVRSIDEKYHLPCYGERFFKGILITKADGVYLYDSTGKRYIDCVAGIASVPVGHCNPFVNKAVAEQMDRVGHLSNLYYIEAQARYEKELAAALPIKNPKLFFCNSGAEATNGAIKLASKNPGHWLVYFSGTFHGRYGAALAATGQQKYQKGFEKTLPQNTKMLEFNNLTDLEQITEDTFAVILEIIKAEGGIIPADRAFIDALKYRCRDTGTLVIVDEVQTAFGRTGKMFAVEHYDFVPDIICMSKGIANGFPFGAIAFSEKVAGFVKKGEHASTFGGNPYGCAAASVTLMLIEDLDLCGHARKMEDVFYSHNFKQCSYVKDARGKGLLLGIELSDADKRQKVIDGCREDGVLFCGCGDSVIRIVPPLIITGDQFDQAMGVLKKNIKGL